MLDRTRELQTFKIHHDDVISNDEETSDKDDKGEIQMQARALNDGNSGSCITFCQRTKLKFKMNSVFRGKILYTVCLFASRFIHGWSRGLFGSSYTDIRMISGSSLDDGSWILTSSSIGFALGSILQGFLYSRVNSKALFGITSIVCCTAFAVVPWCTVFEAMMFTYITIGVGQGVLASGTTVDIISLWGKESRVVFLGSHVVLACGHTVAPLVVAPFLVQIPHAVSFVNTSSDLGNSSSPAPPQITININQPIQYKSDIYVPFSVTSAIFLFSGIFFLALYTFHNKRQTCMETTKTDNVLTSGRNVSNRIKAFILLTVASIFFIFNGVDEVFIGFLATYCLEFFHWSKKDGALLSFIFSLLAFISRILGFLVAKWMNIMIYSVVNFVIVCLSVLGMLMASLYNYDSLVWFFAPVFGFARSCLFPLMFSWTNEYITPMTGRISSFYYTAMMLGSTLNPLLIGNLMEHIDLIWFCYLLLIESCLVLIFVGILVIATRYVLCHYGRTASNTTDKEIEQLNQH
ncbi:sodium-dependent glucose transporter 1-like [Argopecten irradians]|uniref:sodium-dependent glucose transporter 1-like n=1 Tax=Argopecten irradians TaxID=31199 RepID=UPI00372274DA